jgi:hypothetical protein
MYASAQSLDFLAMTKNCSFPNRKQIVSHPEFPDGNEIGMPLINGKKIKLVEVQYVGTHEKAPY